MPFDPKIDSVKTNVEVPNFVDHVFVKMILKMSILPPYAGIAVWTPLYDFSRLCSQEN